MKARVRAAASLALVVPVCSAGCAWTNRDNRPVWNQFEAHVVPDDSPWFELSLPATVPLGLLAAVSDTFVAHPLQVADDAADDAADLWTGLGPELDEHYYTGVVSVPLRAVGTPVWFLGSFLSRSMFDIAPAEPAGGAEVESAATQREQAARRAMLHWLGELAKGSARGYDGEAPAQWDPELNAALTAARAGANADGRYELYRQAWRHVVPLDPLDGLRDPDPVLRYRVLRWMPPEVAVPPELLATLAHDPVESVRLEARRRSRRP